MREARLTQDGTREVRKWRHGILPFALKERACGLANQDRAREIRKGHQRILPFTLPEQA